MKIDKEMTGLICTLENIIGWQTYNPNSYNGWTGEEGCEFKYPVNYCENKKDLKEGKLTKTKQKIQYIDPECVKTMKYAFGSNHLYIGDGIVKVLNYLEKQYDIDFNELEKRRIEKCKEEMELIQKKLKSGDNLILKSGRWKVGEDIPEGKYIVSNDNDRLLMITIYNSKGKEIRDIFTSKNGVKVTLKNGYVMQMYGDILFKMEKE